MEPGYRQVWGLALNAGCDVRGFPLVAAEGWRTDLDLLDELHVPDAADRFERVLEAGESLDRACHRRPVDAGNRRDGTRRQYVRKHMTADQANR